MRYLGLLPLLASFTFTTGCASEIEWLDLHSPNKDRRERAYLEQYSFDPGNVAEPTIDLVEVAAGQTAATATEAPRVGVGVKTTGGPAPDTAYSNFVELRVKYVENPTWRVTLLKERHNGVDATEIDATGGAEADVDTTGATVVATPWGFYFEFPLDEDVDRDRTTFEIILGFLGVELGEYLEEESGVLEFEDTKPVEDILSEIEEVFVPA